MPKYKTGKVRGRRFWSVSPNKPMPAKAKKALVAVRKMSSRELCRSLAGIAAFHVEDQEAQMKIYDAIRRLGLMEDAAIRAGLLPADDHNR